MRSLYFILLATLALSFSAHPAAAFTTDRDAGTNADGSSRFSDPDAQFDDAATPGQSPHGALSFGNSGAFGFGTFNAQSDNETGGSPRSALTH